MQMQKYKLLPVTTGKLFQGYEYWWEEGTCFYQVSFHVHSALSPNVGIYTDSKS